MKKLIKPREMLYEVWGCDSSSPEYWGTFSGIGEKQISKKFKEYAFPDHTISYDPKMIPRYNLHYNDQTFFFTLNLYFAPKKIFMIKMA